MDNNLLISTDWLAAHLNDANLRVVDIRGHVIPASEPPPHYFNHLEDYEQAHIPGAVFVDWVYEITDPNDPRHAQIARPERFEAAMRRLGISADTLVVAYDDAQSMFAARLWWGLNYYGHQRVAVLDGGWNKWIAEGRPTSAERSQVAPGDFTAMSQPAIYRSAEQVLAALHTDITLLDVRTADEFEGRSSRAARSGHLPGAMNQPRSRLVAPDGTMLPAEQLCALFAEVGLHNPDGEVVTYCNGGVSASYGMLALKVAGFERVAVYDGSWKDWGNDDSKPLEV